MKIGHIILSCSSDYGGPVTSLFNIIKFSDIPVNGHTVYCMKTTSCSNKILNLGCPITFLTKFDLLLLFFSSFNYFGSKSKSNFNLSIIHMHGLWHPIFFVFYRISIFYKIPFIVNLRGMLLPVAFGQKKLKKWLAYFFYQKQILDKASILISTSEKELKSCLSFVFKSSSIFVPNPVPLPNCIKNLFNPSDMFTFIFVGRVHPIKGIDLFINALSFFDDYDFQFKIVGPCNYNYISHLNQLIIEHDLNEKIHFIGEKDGIDLDILILSSDVLVLPSYSENFGYVVAESLSNCVPVLTTSGTPWTELDKLNCGWVVDPSVEGLRLGINQCLNTPKDSLISMGKRGREYISKYDANKVSRFNTLIYKHCLNPNTNLPQFIL